ncbi:MAG: NADP-dependent oxidoreductase [Gemmatimonadales bacterium]
MTIVNRRYVLASRPEGAPTAANFRLEEQAVDPDRLAEGQVLVRNRFLSVDPYMRGRMNEGRSYAAPQALDEVMIGGTVGEVVATRHPRFAVGDQVALMGGWQEYALADATTRGAIRPVDGSAIPLSAYLGPVGMPGITAWIGLTRMIEPKAGETVVVSAAAGAVGSVVGQLAKLRGLRAVGIAGGPAKCAHVRDELGFDACVDYKAHPDQRSLVRALKAACPYGVDGIFENVGGVILDASMALTNDFARIAICGMIAAYQGDPIPMAAPLLILTRRLTVRGFIVSEHLAHWPTAQAELAAHVASGKIRYQETVFAGIESTPDAFFGLFEGRNLGKQLVRLY